MVELIEETSKELGIERRRIDDDEVLKRCLYPLINIGAQLLDDGIALRASDIDVVYIYGYGFPKYRGGPMYYADQLGYSERLPRHPCAAPGVRRCVAAEAPLLRKLAEEGSSFAAWDAANAAQRAAS